MVHIKKKHLTFNLKSFCNQRLLCINLVQRRFIITIIDIRRFIITIIDISSTQLITFITVVFDKLLTTIKVESDWKCFSNEIMGAIIFLD